MLTRSSRCDEEQVLRDFRKIARSHAKSFMEAKDHIFDLLGNRQNAESGRFREQLLRSFLAKLLPTAVSVDTGFIYGFEEIETSNQLDIIIWHKASHAPVYDTGQFVIVSPESVIAVISVKSGMTNKALREGLNNLLSIAPLDIGFRRNILVKDEKRMRSIAKFLIFYSQPKSTKSILPAIQKFYSENLIKHPDLLDILLPALNKIDPFKYEQEIWEDISRIYPQLITTLDDGPANYYQGMGPPLLNLGSPEDIIKNTFYSDEIKRLPYMYRHGTKITTAFEKLVFHILQAVYITLESKGLSLLSAWGDLNPATGCRSGDAWELIESEGVPLLDPARLTTTAK